MTNLPRDCHPTKGHWDFQARNSLFLVTRRLQPFRKIQNERGKYPLKIKHFQQ